MRRRESPWFERAHGWQRRAPYESGLNLLRTKTLRTKRQSEIAPDTSRVYPRFAAKSKDFHIIARRLNNG